jgi:hypothetical protein
MAKPDDFCEHGHSPYCEHQDQAWPRCQATYTGRPKGAIRCDLEDGHGGGAGSYFHEGPDENGKGVRYSFPERDAVYPVANSNRVKVEAVQEATARHNLQAALRFDIKPGEVIRASGGPSARDSQVGGDHYRKHKIQVWDIVDEYDLGHYRAAAIKYLLRAGDKGPAVEDLKKAIHYIQKCIEREEGK